MSVLAGARQECRSEKIHSAHLNVCLLRLCARAHTRPAVTRVRVCTCVLALMHGASEPACVRPGSPRRSRGDGASRRGERPATALSPASPNRRRSRDADKAPALQRFGGGGSVLRAFGFVAAGCRARSLLPRGPRAEAALSGRRGGRLPARRAGPASGSARGTGPTGGDLVTALVKGEGPPSRRL